MIRPRSYLPRLRPGYFYGKMAVERAASNVDERKPEQQNQSRRKRQEVRRQTEDAAALLCRAWDEAKRGRSWEWVLAEKFHWGITARLRSVRKFKNSLKQQRPGWLSDFLAMEKQCETERIPEILWRFAAACPQIAADPESDLSKRVLQRYPQVLLAIAKQTAKDFAEGHSEQDLRRLLRRKHFPSRMLAEEGLETVWTTWYVPQAVQSDLKLLLSLEPKDEYPEARAMERHFVLHLGGTNTGKTYEGFRCLRQARTGVYLAPLRLLAVEAQETLLDAGVNCSLTTGEEEDVREDDTHVAATAEKLDLKARYDVAVIDECQMIEDPQRGYAWTRAILGVQAPEVHLCAAPQAKEILVRLIRSCGDSFEIKVHKRRTPLICMNRTVDLEHLQPGDALIAFSKVDVLSVAEELRRSGKEPAIIYGALPYAARRMQMEDFLAGETQYVVATDAIGMGLNLPIRRILFLDTEKFDGVERRELKPQEIQQIAGRAGRYGMYSKGFVGAVRNLSTIQEGLRAAVPQIREAVLGFSDLVLQSRFDLLEVLSEWNRMPAEEPYRKLDISRYIWVISTMRQRGFALSKEEELRAANIPFDETDSVLEELFFFYLRCYAQGDPIQQPQLEGPDRTLPELESYCRKLDLYFSFAKTFRYPVDTERLREARDNAAEDINEILIYRLQNNIRFCEICGKPLPLSAGGKVCDVCRRKMRK